MIVNIKKWGEESSKISILLRFNLTTNILSSSNTLKTLKFTIQPPSSGDEKYYTFK